MKSHSLAAHLADSDSQAFTRRQHSLSDPAKSLQTFLSRASPYVTGCCQGVVNWSRQVQIVTSAPSEHVGELLLGKMSAVAKNRSSCHQVSASGVGVLEPKQMTDRVAYLIQVSSPRRRDVR